MSEAPLCKCGCGQQVRWSRSRNRFSEFVNGHNTRIMVKKKCKHLIQKGFHLK